ncbi:MAG: DNA replication/repair protein RecF, partial [Acidiferrobacterales bacterium]
MALTLIEVQNLRVFRHVVLEPSHGLNVIFGPNGSGKTSLLEAVHILGMGRSFRTGAAAYPVRRGAVALTVRGCWCNETGEEVSVGVERGREYRRIRVNGDSSERASTLAQLLPLQAVLPDTRYLFLHSARFRRGVLDWGLFHVEQQFYGLWAQYRRALRQRNAALKAHDPVNTLRAWEQTLAQTGEQIDQWRADYEARWYPCAAQYAVMLLPGTRLQLRRHRCWPSGMSLAQALRGDRERDKLDGYTRAGIHRADL